MPTEVARTKPKPPVAPVLSTAQFIAVIEKTPAIVEAQALTKQVNAWIAGKPLVLKDATALEAAGAWLRKIKASQADVEDGRTVITKPLNDLLRQVNAKVKETSDPLLPLERTIKNAVIAYDQEQDRIRRAAQKKLDDEAAAERKKIEDAAIAARNKAADDARKLREEAEKLATAGRLADAEKLKAKAVRAEDKGDERAMQLETRSAAVVAPILSSGPARVSGMVRKKVWQWKFPQKDGKDDPSGVKPAFLIPNEPMITKMVKAVGKDAESIIGGIVCEQVDDIAGGRK